MMMNYIILSLVSLVALTACAYDPMKETMRELELERQARRAEEAKKPSPWVMLQKEWGEVKAGLAQYRGKHISYAIGKLGEPSAVRVIRGDKYYRWETDQTDTSTVHVPTMQHFSASGESMYEGGIAFHSQSGYITGSEAVTNTVHSECHLTMQVDSKDIVVGSRAEGNIAGCGKYKR
jgi:hypothetical protein